MDSKECNKILYPDNTIWVSSDDDILCVPFIHLGHTAAQDLLTAPSEGIGTSNGAAINAPHVNVRACAGHNVPLHKHTPKASNQQFLAFVILFHFYFISLYVILFHLFSSELQIEFTVLDCKA